MLANIVTKLGPSQYIVTHGFGFSGINVIVNAQPIRLNIRLSASLIITNPTVIVAAPVRLNVRLRGTPVIIPGTKILADPIRLAIELRGAAVGSDTFILDFEAKINLQPQLEANINTNLTFLTPVELEEEVMKVRIT
jgi:hypothetical protein